MAKILNKSAAQFHHCTKDIVMVTVIWPFGHNVDCGSMAVPMNIFPYCNM